MCQLGKMTGERKIVNKQLSSLAQMIPNYTGPQWCHEITTNTLWKIWQGCTTAISKSCAKTIWFASFANL